MDPAATEPELEQGEDQDDDKKSHGDRRSITKIKILKCLFVNVDDYAFASVAWAAPGQDNNSIENLNCSDHEDDQNEKDGWAQKRKSNPEKKLNRVGPIEARGS
jgi:hypothetical protein